MEKECKNGPPKRAVVTLAEPMAQQSLDKRDPCRTSKCSVNVHVAALPLVFMPVSQFHASRNDDVIMM